MRDELPNLLVFHPLAGLRLPGEYPLLGYSFIKYMFTLLLSAAVFLWLLAGGILGWPGLPWYLWMVIGFLGLTLLIIANDERQPHIEGANDNATAVSILLGMVILFPI